MKRIGSSVILGVALLVTAQYPAVLVMAENIGQARAVEYVSSHRWASTVIDQDGHDRITVHNGDKLIYLTQDRRDQKPVWSGTGGMLAFFRWQTYEKQGGGFNMFNAICVAKVDGSGVRELTDYTHANMNPTWTRDGSNQILFNRIRPKKLGISIYMTHPDGPKNSEKLVTHPDRDGLLKYEWVESGLKDGRLFIWRVNWFRALLNFIKPGDIVDDIQTWQLLDPATHATQEVSRPHQYPVHKLSVSPSETRICYMKAVNGNPLKYKGSVIAYAELDLENLVVKNEVLISPDDRSYTDMYPRWSPDEKHIMYSSSRSGTIQQYLYSLETKETHLVSVLSPFGDMYPNFEDMPK